MSVMVFFTAFSYPNRANSMRLWGIGIGVRAIFWSLLAFRDMIPDFFSIVVANTGLILSELVLLKALKILHGKDLDNRWFYLCGSIAVVFLSYFTYISPSLFWRIECVSAISVFAALYGCFTLFFSKSGNKSFTEISCGLLYLICAIATIFRGGYVAFANPQTTDLLSVNDMQNIALAVVFVCLVMMTFVYMLIINSEFNNELKKALSEVKTLSSMLPICSYCRDIRDDNNKWQKLEDYLQKHTEFSHGICPDCYENEVVPQLEAFKSQFQN